MKAKLYKVLDQYHLYDGNKAIATTIVGNPMLLPNLSKQNFDEIFGIIDVEKLADEYLEKHFSIGLDTNYIQNIVSDGIKYGFNKAMALNKDKVFALEEVHKLLRLIHILPNFELEQFEDENNVLQIDTFISHHIQQPTEIEVEIESKIAIDGHTILGYELDSEGCLILKKL